MPGLSAVRRYTVAVLLTLLALSLALVGERNWGPATTYSLFLGAVMLSSWISGLGPGILSTVVGTVAADYFLIAPFHTLTFDASRLVQLSAFVATAALISSLNESRRRAADALAAERAQLEERVAARTAELAAANATLQDEMDRRSRSESNFRGLIDAAPDAIVVIDISGRITTVNAQAEKMFGYARDVMIGHDVEKIVPERFRAAHRAKREQYADGPTTRTIAGDLTGRRADGSEFPIEIRISPLDMRGARSIVGIVRDVTERHRAQEVREKLVHDLGERVKELSALHATGRSLLESGSPTEVLTRIVALLPRAWQYPDIAAARISVADIDVQTPQFAKTPWLQRAEFMTPKGEAGLIEVVYRERRSDAPEGPFLTEERNLIESLAGMLRAYFERLQLEEDRIVLARAESARQQAQDANGAKDQFLATLSHELRSPLNVMLGWTQMLRKSRMSPESTARGFEVLERSVRLQAKLIDDLLDVSRIVAGKLRIDTRKVDLSAVVDVAVDAARPAARARDVTLTATIAPGLVINADSQRLQQVVSNLLMNALKFTPAHGSVHVDVVRLGASAQITVKDTGIGIARELMPRIFDRFQQGDASTTRTHSGLGLGLAIVKHLVELQEGRIEAASAGRGCGASLTVTMPLVTGELAAVHPIRPAPSSPDPSLLAGVRVLVVDDEADARTTLAAMLQGFGAEPTVVASADAACDAISRNRPDILLSDVAMPDQDGYVLIRRIRSTVDSTRLPAAALSGRVYGDSKAQALDAGYQVYLEKPIEPAELAETLAALVHRAHTV